MRGTVIKTTGSLYDVKSENGDLIECRLKGKFRTKEIKSITAKGVESARFSSDGAKIITHSKNTVIIFDSELKVFFFHHLSFHYFF